MKSLRLILLLSLAFLVSPVFVYAEATSTQSATTTPALHATSTAPTIIATFEASPASVDSESPVSFVFKASGASSYTLFLQCPLGISVLSEGSERCKTQIPIVVPFEDSKTLLIRFKNEATTAQNVTATFFAYDAAGREVGSKKEVVVVNSSPSLRASITTFSLEKGTASSAGARGTSFTAKFTGSNIDSYRIRVSCPVPSTVAGIRERLNLVKSGSLGLLASIKDTATCVTSDTVSSAVQTFSFRIENPFKNIQSYFVQLKAYNWDGEKDVFGQSKTEIVTLDPQ